jgi:hypothetical protein
LRADQAPQFRGSIFLQGELSSGDVHRSAPDMGILVAAELPHHPA